MRRQARNDVAAPETAAAVKERLLSRMRAARAFDVERVVDLKVRRLVAWFRESSLDAVVLGVSGGVDSAVVLALLLRAHRREPSVLRRVVALLMPVSNSSGATSQDEATRLGRAVVDALGAEHWHVPLGDSLRAMTTSIARGSELAFDAWSEGQCLSVVRTPALYGAAALLQTHGFRSIVVGTTNRDEGSYIGFFGKASDAMVDLQPISDLHKSEVRAVARYLGVPADIVDRAPAGDVFDGRVDEEMIGASYDDVELFLRLRENELDPRAFFLLHLHHERAYAAIERIHLQNRHKYAVGNPSVHLDVMPRAVPGGWTAASANAGAFTADRDEKKPPPNAIPGFWEPPPSLLLSAGSSDVVAPTLIIPTRTNVALTALHDERGAFACVVERALTNEDCDRLIAAMSASGASEAVGVTGVRDAGGYGIGSTRATGWSPELAAQLFARIRSVMPSVRFLDDNGFTDAFAQEEPRHEQRPAHYAWRLVGLSPLLRFMKYEKGGRHLCHYDAAYDYGDGRRTLMSVVFYLSDSQKSGATRFVRDRNDQERLPTHARDFSDWDRDTREDEVIARVQPSKGDVLVFDHRLCHDVELYEGDGDRVIIRADIVYEAIPPSPWRSA